MPRRSPDNTPVDGRTDDAGLRLHVVSDGRAPRRRPAHARIPWLAWVAGIVIVLVGLWTIAAVLVVSLLVGLLAILR